MNKIVLVFYFLLAINSFGQLQKSKSNTIVCTIENPLQDSLVIVDKNKKNVKTLYPNKNAQFITNIIFNEGYYYLNNGKKDIELYLNPNFKLNIFFNTKNIDSTLTFSGEGACVNNFIQRKKSYCKSFGNLYYGMDKFALDELNFLKKTDSIFQLLSNFLTENKENLDDYFFFLESQDLKYNQLDRIAKYEALHQFMTNNTKFKVSKKFPNPFSEIDKENSSLLNVKSYIPFIETYIHNETNKQFKNNEEIDYVLTYSKLIQNLIPNAQIKNELAINVGLYDLSRTEEVDSVFMLIKSVISDKDKLDEIQLLYEKIKTISVGNLSPDFLLNDLDGNQIKLSELKGQMVYIDIWASWCLPCIKEFPYLNSLKDSLEGSNIIFVNICKDDSEANWRKIVEEKQLKGINLFAPNNEISFFKDYDVKSLPRFILLDEAGRIVNAHAERPSNPKLKNIIDSYLR